MDIEKQKQMSKFWLLLSSLMFLFLGQYAYRSPIEYLIIIVFYIAIVKASTGVIGVITHFKNRKNEEYNGHLFISLIDLSFGFFLLFAPKVLLATTYFIPFFISMWAIIRGATMIYTGVKVRKIISKWWLEVVLGSLTVIGGIIVYNYQYIATVTLTKLLGVFLLFMGLSLFFQFIASFFRKKI